MSSEAAPPCSEQSMEEFSRELHGKKVLRRFDSLDIESSTVHGRQGHGSRVRFLFFFFFFFKTVTDFIYCMAYMATGTKQKLKFDLMLLFFFLNFRQWGGRWSCI
jgi:hypothetical protein